MTTSFPLVSIVIPCLNGAQRLPSALSSLSCQDYPSELLEVIVADGGSTDRTREIALAAGAKVIDNPGRCVAAGRNEGYSVSKGTVVAFTDDDCTFPANWVSNAVRRLAECQAGGVGGPTWVPEGETSFGRAVAIVFAVSATVVRSVHRESVPSTEEVTDLPGCNCFFWRHVLDQIMPTDETFVTGEDIELCLRVREKGYRLYLVPDVALWHHKRPTPRRLFSQIYRYAVGRVQIGRLHPQLLRAGHIMVGLFIPLICAIGITMLVVWPRALEPISLLLFLATAVAGALGAAYRSKAMVAIWLTLLLVLVPTAWSLGFLKETLCPVKRRFFRNSSSG